jgi:ATP-dependent DNA helicase RecG
MIGWVVESPGGFPPFVSPENIYENTHPRNPHLMDAMYYMKAANEGTRRMRDTMVSMNLPRPEFAEKESGQTHQVRVTLKNNVKLRNMWVDADVSSLVGEALLKGLSEHERMAVNWIAEHGEINVSQLQRLTGRTWPSASKLLQGMVFKNILAFKHRSKLDRDPQSRYLLRKIGDIDNAKENS